ncbi:hypothetical protein WJX73_010664 [Symbiochloris irregularis]|uniref:Uncharacterized protein n=1 Tax=Symbiochloris irregularis TaxID=706552 RepID=A0AAW1PDS5_9CHLO
MDDTSQTTFSTPARTTRRPLGDLNQQSGRDLPQWNASLRALSIGKGLRPQSAFKRSVAPPERTPVSKQPSAAPKSAQWSTDFKQRGSNLRQDKAPQPSRLREPVAAALWDLPNANNADFWVKKAAEEEAAGDLEGARQAFLDAKKRRAAPAAAVRKALAEFESRHGQDSTPLAAVSRQPDQPVTADHAPASAMQAGARGELASKPSRVRFASPDANMQLPSATPAQGQGSVCSASAGSTPYLRSGSTARMQTPRAAGLGRGIRGMGTFDSMPESPLDMDAEAGLNATPGTVSKLLVGPVLQDAIRTMARGPPSEASASGAQAAALGSIPPLQDATTPAISIAGSGAMSQKARTPLTGSFDFPSQATPGSATPKIAFERTKAGAVLDDDDVVQLAQSPVQDHSEGHQEQDHQGEPEMPDTAHKFQNPLFGSTPNSLSGSESPMCHIEAYTPATAAKPMHAMGSAEPASGAGQTSEADDSNTPMHTIVRRDIFEDLPGSAKESEAGSASPVVGGASPASGTGSASKTPSLLSSQLRRKDIGLSPLRKVSSPSPAASAGKSRLQAGGLTPSGTGSPRIAAQHGGSSNATTPFRASTGSITEQQQAAAGAASSPGNLLARQALPLPSTPTVQSSRLGANAPGRTPRSAFGRSSVLPREGATAWPPSAMREKTPSSKRPSVGRKELRALYGPQGPQAPAEVLGSRAQLSPITANSRLRQKAMTGDAQGAQVLTPVRRSVRTNQTPTADPGSMLRRTRFTYVPNEAMQPRLDPNTPLADATKASLFADSSD